MPSSYNGGAFITDDEPLLQSHNIPIIQISEGDAMPAQLFEIDFAPIPQSQPLVFIQTDTEWGDIYANFSEDKRMMFVRTISIFDRIYYFLYRLIHRRNKVMASCSIPLNL